MTTRKKASKKKAAVRAMTQSAVIKEVAEYCELTRQQVKDVLLTLAELAERELNPRSRVAPGKMLIPGICRLVAKKKPARKARPGRNPFTGEEMMFKAKPATTAIRIQPVKALKDAVAGNK